MQMLVLVKFSFYLYDQKIVERLLFKQLHRQTVAPFEAMVTTKQAGFICCDNRQVSHHSNGPSESQNSLER